MDSVIGAAPFPIFQRGDGQAELELERFLGMEITTAVATHDFELSVDCFDNVGCGKRFPHVFGVLQEGQVVRTFLPEFTDPGGISLGEAVAELFKLAIADLDVPRGFDGSPSLLKLNGIGL